MAKYTYHWKRIGVAILLVIGIAMIVYGLTSYQPLHPQQQEEMMPPEAAKIFTDLQAIITVTPEMSDEEKLVALGILKGCNKYGG